MQHNVVTSSNQPKLTRRDSNHVVAPALPTKQLKKAKVCKKMTQKEPDQVTQL
jgi:hypothetical protein